MNHVIKTVIATLAMSTAFSAFAAQTTGMSLGELKSKSYISKKISSSLKGGDETGIRLNAMREAAMSTGAQHGYLSRINQLKNQLNSISSNLDDIYDFSVLMRLASGDDTSLYFLPPVIHESKNIISVTDDEKKIRISGKMYEITKPERLVTLAPNWRQYLVYDTDIEVSEPHPALLPKNKKEQEHWALSAEEGWKAGTAQAEREMIYRIRQLGGDFVGMTRYMTLLAEGKVSKSMIVKSTEDVTGGGNQMREDEQIFQLTNPVKLNPNNKSWKAISSDTRGSLRQPSEIESFHDPLFN